METIDFGCQVRCLNRQRIVPGSGHPPLNQCASQFLAKVRKECSSANFDSNSGGWMKLRLSDRGLRIWPASPGSSSGSTSEAYSALHRRSDEGFESDSEHSDSAGRNCGSDAMHSGGSSSGVNSSSSDIEEGETSLFSTSSSVRAANQSVINQLDDAMSSVRCVLSDILSCQHPPALGRHVVLLTLRSPDDAGLDILALECSAEEPARILTLLCQKIANPVQSHQQKEQKEQPKPVVSIQPWTERAKSPEPEEVKTPSAQNIIRKLERQNSGWNLIQRRSDDGLTHLQVANSTSSSSSSSRGSAKKTSATAESSRVSRKDLPPSGLKRSDSVLTKASKSSTNEAPARAPEWAASSQKPTGTKRWTFGAPFRQTFRPPSPDSSPPRRARGRSVERKTKGGPHQPDLEGLYIGNQPSEQPVPKIKRDPSKTRSFLMKWTTNRKPSTPPPASDLGIGPDVPAAAPAAIGLRQRGRSLIRLRSARNNSPPPAPQQPVHPHTFLIPTKSGHELTRTLYPKESGLYSAPALPQTPTAVYYVPSSAGRGLPRITPAAAAYYPAPHWSAYCWNDRQSDNNNNNNQQQWIYFQPLANGSAGMSKADWKKIQRSRSQSPGRSRSSSSR